MSMWDNTTFELIDPRELLLDNNARTILDIQSEAPDLVASVKLHGVMVPLIANATAHEVAHGLRWYLHAHHVALAIADGDAHLGAGMLAVYSPQQTWTANLLLAAQVLRARTGIGGAGSGSFATAAQRAAADRLLAGESWERVLSGPKIRAFAHLIEHGEDLIPDHPQVVIDRHALSVAHGAQLTAAVYSAAPLRAVRRRAGSVQHPYYSLVADLFQQAAAEISHQRRKSVAPHQVQAVTWLVRQLL